ncbi:MAG TPA: zinc-dependent alcohol dehydrogenase family protein [Candidatus Hydrogenedens sp.]|nr:zinc-dependent alcohol dehydrogenase family protein [Candidatus Hydrogenedens sp.]HOL20007.1 zinc-dependent alcohol dehydrogenase family protein [Candidatus Hydrogenedens sp.]HPP59172.1 zinc-dependent alcohol dehydrogenase family protein [Candidatus Hydrogenedens sp.]
MKVMALYQQAPIQTHPLIIEDWDIPKPKEKELLIKINCCAICRTDLHIIEGELPLVVSPIIPGHQIVGTVIEIGTQCTKYKVGDKVGIAWLRMTCGTCDFCKIGLENLCKDSLYTGYHQHGGYAEYTVVNEDFAYALPKNLDDPKIAPLLCAGIIGFRAWKKTELRKKNVLAIYGFGASAHIILQIAKAKGVTVFVVSQRKNHQELAIQLGADWAGSNPSELPELPDASIIFAPNGNLIPTALEYLKKGGRLVLAGIYMSDTPPLNYERHIFYEKHILSVTSNTRVDGQELLKEAINVKVKTHVELTPLKEVNELLQKLKENKINGSGVVVM